MSFCYAILSKFLDQYIEKVDKNQVKVSLLKGHVELSNISFTSNLLTSFGIPLTIKDSHTDHIVVDFPILKNNNDNAYFKVINVDIFAVPEWNALNKVSINSVADLIQSTEDEKKATKADKQKVWNSWIEKIIDNATIEIRNVRLHIEFDNWDNKTSALTLFFESLLMNTVDSEGKIITLKQKPEILRKRLNLSSFSIALHTNVEPFKSFEQLNSVEYNFLMQSSFTLTMIHDRRKNSSFFNTFTIVFDPIFFDIKQEQYFALEHLLNDFSKSQVRQKFISCMKPSDEKMNLKYYIKMWSFLYRCAIKIRRPHHFSPEVALQFLKKRKEYAKSFIKTINQKSFIKKSIKNNGEDLTFLLIQYSLILARRKERMIKLDKNEIDTITSDDLRFFSKDSFQFNLNIQGICFKLHSFVIISINDINFLFEKKRENVKLNLEVQNWIINDISSNYKVIQTHEEGNNFINFSINSRDDPAIFEVSQFKIDVRSSFLKKFTQFFINNSNSTNQRLKTDEAEESNDKIVKSSSINQFLIKLNPKTLMKFKIRILGFSVGYEIDDAENKALQHSFHCEIKHVELKNFSKNSTEKKLIIKSKMIFGEMKVDESIISEEFSFKSSTTGIIDEYYFLNDLSTNLDVLNAKIDIDSLIIDKASNILASIANSSKQNNQTKVYSSHKIYLNCSDISIFINNGIYTLIFSISGIDINPSIEFRNISILEKNKDPKINIPKLCLNKWPIIETDLLSIKLNSYEFFDLLDEMSWIAKQITKLSSSFIPKDGIPEIKAEEEIKDEDLNDKKKENIQVVARLIDYKMGDRANSMKFNNVVCVFDDNFDINIGSLSLNDSDDKQFVFCENKISLKMNSTEDKSSFSINVPDLNMNFLWNEINNIIEYFQDSRNQMEQNVNKRSSIVKDDSIESMNKLQNEILITVEKSSFNIENSFILLLDNLTFKFLVSENSSLLLNMDKINIDNLLEVNDFHFQINSFIYDISISSINANLSQEKALKISELSFLPSILNNNKNSSEKKESNSQMDLNININNFTFIESSTNLTLEIPIIKFTINSYHSIGAIHIPSINFESLRIDNIKIFLLFNSTNFNQQDIDSVFLLDRKEVSEAKDFILTNIVTNINSIDFEYTHYFVMRIFNAYKIYSKYALNAHNDDGDSNNSDISISAIINQINITESNLNDSISLSEISFEKSKDITEFKCNSINFIDLIKLRKEEGKDKSHFLLFQTNKFKTNIEINPIDVYLNINTLKKLTNIYESISSLIKTDFHNKSQNEITINDKNNEKQNNCYIIDVSGIQVHFPFEDDPMFLEHALILSLDLKIEYESNSHKLLNVNNLNIFFTNYKKQMNFLPLLNEASFYFRAQNNNDPKMSEFVYSLLEIETGAFNINVSALDIFELQMIVNNFMKSFDLLIHQKTFSMPDEIDTKKSTFSTINSKLDFKPISISLCGENRASTLFNPIFTLCIEPKDATLNLQNQIQSFSIDLIFSIMNMNLIDGKIETFMPQTDFFVSHSNGDSDTAFFGLVVKTDIDFNITSSSFENLLKFVRKFTNKDKILIFKNESKFNYKPEYWIQNNLDDIITIQYKMNDADQFNMMINPNDHLPMCELQKDTLLTFIYKDIKESINIESITFPIYFKSISVSTVSHNNSSKSIVFNSPLSIQNKLDCNLFIYIKPSKDAKQFVNYIKLQPKCIYPLSLEEKQYFIFSDFEPIFRKQKYKKNKNLDEVKNYQIDPSQPPEVFNMSLNKPPKSIKIQNIKSKKSVSFVLNVNNNHRTNTRIYEIIPSFFIKNLLPCPIFAKINNSNDYFILQSQEEKQINSFNHDNQSFLISLNFNSNLLQDSVLVKLDNENDIVAANDCTAIQVQKILKTNQKRVVIFAPCAIFNNTEETIHFSPSSSPEEQKITPNNFVFYGLKNYNDNEKSMKIDISIENSQKKLNAIDCMQLNSNCTTVYLPRIDNPQLFYPLNCSITLGQFPMNATHVVTFTHYLYVINNLPFDFSLVPITSEKVNLLESNYKQIDKLIMEIENESQFLLKDSFYVPHENENRLLIKWVPKDGMFLFSASKYPNNPIIQLNGINRTVFMVKNKKEKFYIELNIYEDKSTLYAHFQVPTFPVPLVINNSLNTNIYVYQNIKPNENRKMIIANSSSLFAFKEPFINNKQIVIEIAKENKREKDNTSTNNNNNNIEINKDDIEHNPNNNNNNNNENSNDNSNKESINDNSKEFSQNVNNNDSNEITNAETCDEVEYVSFLFSMEEQLSPLISKDHNIIVSTTIISENNSRMIQVRYLDDIIIYQNPFRGFISINSLRFSISSDVKEIALFTMKNIMAEFCQDNKSTFLTLSIDSIQLDNQNTTAKIPVCLIGTGRDIIKNSSNSKNDRFLSILSIFPRGVPFFTVINFMSIQMKPIFVVPETSMIIDMLSFFKELFKSKSGNENNDDDLNALIIEPSFKSVTVNKSLIAYLEIDPINIFIRIPNERTKENYYVSTVMKLLNMISLNKLSFSIPKLFVSEFNNNISYLMEILYDFYGNEVIKQVTKNTVIKMVASSLISFKSLHFVPLSELNNDNCNELAGDEACDNRKTIFGYFNEIELNDVVSQSKYYFDQTPDVIGEILDATEPISNILVYHPSNQNDRPNIHSNKERFIVGIKNDSNVNINSNNLDLLQIFQSSDIKRVKIPIFTPIYSQIKSKLNKDDGIYLKIQTEILKDKKLENQTIKFIIESSEDHLIYCVTNEMILIFVLKSDSIQLSQKVEFSMIDSISSSGSLVSLKSTDKKIGQINIQFNREVDANLLIYFIQTQQKVISIFGSAI